jgi:hypothetical protein
MKRLHFAFGAAGLLIFILTGQVMRLHQPPMPELAPEYRMMLYRGTSIYRAQH